MTGSHSQPSRKSLILLGALLTAQPLVLATLGLPDATIAHAASATPEDDRSPERILGAGALSADIVNLLEQTRKTYGEDALILQLQLLHHAIHADSILAAGTRVDGVQPHAARRYLAYTVETGIVFHTTQTAQPDRIAHVWNQVVLPSLAPLKACDVPADGVAIQLSYFHRPYKDTAELQSTVRDDNGQAERVAFYLLRRDIIDFNDKKISAARLYKRAHPVVDGDLFGKPANDP